MLSTVDDVFADEMLQVPLLHEVKLGVTQIQHQYNAGIQADLVEDMARDMAQQERGIRDALEIPLKSLRLIYRSV